MLEDNQIIKQESIGNVLKERPMCVKCGKPALLLWGNNFLCGKCAKEYNDHKNKVLTTDILGFDKNAN